MICGTWGQDAIREKLPGNDFTLFGELEDSIIL